MTDTGATVKLADLIVYARAPKGKRPEKDYFDGLKKFL
jgi:hypothetical protein